MHDGTSLRTIPCTSLTVDRSRDLAEVSAFGDTSKKYIVGLRDAQLSGEGPHDVTIEGYLNAAFNLDTDRAWEFYPAGEVTGNVKLTGNLVMTGLSESSDVGDANSWSFEAQISGDVTRALVP